MLYKRFGSIYYYRSTLTILFNLEETKLKDTTNQEVAEPEHNPWKTRPPVDIPDHVLDQFNIDNLRVLIRKTPLWEFWHDEDGLAYKGINAKRRLQAILKALLRRENELSGNSGEPLRGRKYQEVTHEDIRKQFDYDPVTGKLTHRRLGRVYDLEEPEPVDFSDEINPNPKCESVIDRAIEGESRMLEEDGSLYSGTEYYDRLSSFIQHDHCDQEDCYHDDEDDEFDLSEEDSNFSDEDDGVDPIEEHPYFDDEDDEKWEKYFKGLNFDPANQHRIKVKGHLFPATQIIWMWQTGNWVKGSLHSFKGAHMNGIILSP